MRPARRQKRLAKVRVSRSTAPNISSAVREWMSSPAAKASFSGGTSAMCAASLSSICE